VRRKKKDIILEKILVEDYAAEGKSLARVNGKVIFIGNVVPGDIVDLRLLKNKKDWAEAIPLKVHTFSPDRVTAFCSHFGVCGGCQWQMLPYEKQLQYKHRQVEETLKRIGKVSLPVFRPIMGADETRYYRNKLEYTFGTREFTKEKPPQTPPKEGLRSTQSQLVEHSDLNAKYKLLESAEVPPSGEFKGAGFHAKGFFDKIVDIQTCYLQPEPTNQVRLAVKEFAIQQGWPFYDIREHTGFLRNMQVRLCTTGEIMVNIVVAEDEPARIKLLMEFVRLKFPGITTLLYTINRKWNDSLNELSPVIFDGKGYVIERLTTVEGESFNFKIGPTSFFQTNTKQSEKLYQVTREFAALTGKETVYDLYCGTGSIGIFVSKNAAKVIGVEMIEAATRDAKENALLNDIINTEFYTGDVADICTDEFFAAHGKPDVIIIDPPRAGMHEKLVRKILAMEASVVVYVSCNPATQARDMHLLDEKYSVTNVQPVDMFPHTHHIENVVQLKLRMTDTLGV